MSRTIHLHSGIIILDGINEKFATSITFKDGTVSAINQRVTDNAISIDLKGQTLVPGLIDSHLHLLLGSSGAGDVDLSTCTTRNTFEQQLLLGLDTLDADQWLIASGWSEQALGMTPQINWFDCIQDVPVLCWRTDFHAAILNQTAIDLLDLDAIQNIAGGQQCREGIIKETALWQHVCPVIPSSSSSQIERRLHDLAHALHTNGITLVGAMEELKDVEKFLFPMRHDLGLRMRIMSLDSPSPTTFQRCNVFKDDPFLAITGFKTFIDGTLGSRTAKMYQPYCDVQSSGLLVEHALDGTLDQWAYAVADAGYAPVMHAIGDQAVSLALSTLRTITTDVTPRIEHAQFISEEDLCFIDGQWFGVQPLHKKDDDQIAPQAVGQERASILHNWRCMLDGGARLSFGSDWPIAPHTPIKAMSAAILNGITPKEALVATTADAADSLREPLAGRLNIGCFADATLLDTNPLTCDWQKEIPAVIMTIVDGAIQFEQERTDA